MTQVSGSIQNVSGSDTSGVASVKWTPPTNKNETVIDYYSVTLIGSHTNDTIILINKDTSMQTYSYSFGLSDTNYSAASVVAVDTCGQFGEPSLSVLNQTSSTFSNPSTDGHQPVIAGLAAAFTVTAITAAVLAIIGVTILIVRKCN